MALCEARTPRRAALTPAQSLRTAHGGFWALLGQCPPCASGGLGAPSWRPRGALPGGGAWVEIGGADAARTGVRPGAVVCAAGGAVRSRATG